MNETNQIDLTENFMKSDSWDDFFGEIKDQYIGYNEILIKGVKLGDPLRINGKLLTGKQINVRFSDCHFKSTVNSTENKTLNLIFDNGCTFKDEVAILTRNQAGISIQDCEFFKKLSIHSLSSTGDRNLNDILLKDSKFHAGIIFGDGEYDGFIILENSKFYQKLPDFRYSRFSRNLNLNSFYCDEKTIINKFLESPDYDTPELARDLKLRCAQSNDHDRELDFFAIESRTRAVLKKGYYKFVSDLYSLFSDYGRSISKPLIGILIIFGLLLVINCGTALSTKQPKGKYVGHAFFVSVNDSLPFPLAFNKDSIKASNQVIFENEYPPMSYQYVRLFLVSINLVLWFCFLLSIRNFLKLK
ncbi:hypothetical protein [Marinicella litoralis]|nr:hypothetical protein [Marinicella litoralis]